MGAGLGFPELGVWESTLISCPKSDHSRCEIILISASNIQISLVSLWTIEYTKVLWGRNYDVSTFNQGRY
jgi:hypothetical protein